jgi:hypothetical protein
MLALKLGKEGASGEKADPASGFNTEAKAIGVIDQVRSAIDRCPEFADQASLRQARLSELDSILNGTRGRSRQQAPPSAVKKLSSDSRSSRPGRHKGSMWNSSGTARRTRGRCWRFSDLS